MGTKTNAGQFDCYANADPDEPMFVLLGRDRHAAMLVRIWALLRHGEDEDAVKVTEALACADQMEAWQRRLGKDPRKFDDKFEDLLLAATEGMDDHPDGYDHPCDCDECRSYD